MSDFFGGDYLMCKSVGRSVCVRQAEGQCRSEHGCTQEDCPLAHEFSDPPVEEVSPEFIPGTGPGWLADRPNE